MRNQPKVKTLLDRGRSGAPYHENSREHRKRQAANKGRRHKIRGTLKTMLTNEVRGME
jgi:hypothetical protein